MPEKISWMVNLQIQAGPKASVTGSTEVDAYDKLTVLLDAGAVDIDVAVQPGAAGQVRLLYIHANPYDAAITYSADAGGTTVTLDGPQVLIGTGAVGLLGGPPQTLRFANATANPATIEIIVGRAAV